MENKHTFWSLSNTYNKIEIPIIQRDYAQGRNSIEVIRIRKDFTKYLINALCTNQKVELDFVYGSIERNNVFVPLDGQQRLTTLFLLYWYIAAKEGRLEEAQPTLEKFTYETRPSSHDFCSKLIHNDFSANIVNDIKDSIWYIDDWDNDPSVTGMLTMLDTFAKNEQLKISEESLFDRLIDITNPIISFYFIPLSDYGLTENLYIRMNARGKVLNSFENFKSEFYKIIRYDPTSMKEFKDNVEYQWVENLWEYKDNKSFIVDQPFMQFLTFITEMLYFKQAEVRADSYEKFSKDDLINLDILREVYSNEENLRFLIFAFNMIKEIKELKTDILWDKDKLISIHQILSNLFKGGNDITSMILLYATFRYRYRMNLDNNFYDYIRVIRNLTYNTADKSRREWPRLFKSIESLIDNKIYDSLTEKDANLKMEGFYQPQRAEEIFKANVIKNNPDAKKILFEAEDNILFGGNITSIINAVYAENEKQLRSIELQNLDFNNFNSKKLAKLVESYIIISKDGFRHIWGDLIRTDLYTQYPWGRLIYDTNYKKHPAIISMSMKYYKIGYSSNMTLNDFSEIIQKDFVKRLHAKNPNFNEIKNVKAQLYLYYILTSRVLNKNIFNSFFKNGFNFGWLPKETKFVSSFACGIENDNYYSDVNPIFQTYGTQFRYNSGLKADHALDVEIVGSGKKQKPFDCIIDWAFK